MKRFKWYRKLLGGYWVHQRSSGWVRAGRRYYNIVSDKRSHLKNIKAEHWT